MLGTIKTTKAIDDKLERFYELHQNAGFNLTSIKEKKEFYTKHYLDSVYIFEKAFKPHGCLADIGSGGGFPGIVLAIFYPEVKVTLIESIGKKCKFLEMAALGLDLDNIEVINSRAENIKGRVFDIITARGVAPVKDVIKNTLAISKANSKWVLYKGEKTAEELSEAATIIKAKELKVETIRIEDPFTRTYCILAK